MNTSCPYKPRKVLTEKQAKKQPIGSFYHPTESTFRSGACPEGFDLRKGYEKKSYERKDGIRIKGTYVDPVCVKNKGLPGKVLKEYKVIKISSKEDFKPYGYSTSNNSNSRFKSLLEACKVLTYGTVVRKLNALKIYLKNRTDEKGIRLSNIYNEDIKMLQNWRIKNPDLYKKKINLRGGDLTDYLPISFKTKIAEKDLRRLISIIKSLLQRFYIHENDKDFLKKYSRLSMLNVSKIKNMESLFEEFPFHLIDNKKFKNLINSTEFKELTGIEKFDIDITGWNVSNVKVMRKMFMNSTNFNQDLSNWNVTNVVDMTAMFYNSVNFNQDLSNWNVTNVNYMGYMFYNCVNFNQDLTSWNDKLINLKMSRDAFKECNINEKYIPQRMTDEEQNQRNSNAKEKAEGKMREKAYLNRLAYERDR
jgi:surface protein